VLWCYAKFKPEFDAARNPKNSERETAQEALMKQIKSKVRQHQNSFTFDCYLKAITFTEYHARAETLLKTWLKKKKIKYPSYINQLPSYIELSDAESLSATNSKAPSDPDLSPSENPKIDPKKNAINPEKKKKKTDSTSSGNPSINARANKFAEDEPGGYLAHIESDQNLTDAIDL
jgi:hypothetical protein